MSQPSELPEYVFSPWQRRQGLADIVERVLTYPIHHKRWEKIKDRLNEALNDRASSHQQSPDTERQLWAQTALSLALPQLPRIAFAGHDLAADSLDAWARALRRIVNTEATEDLLGPAWRPPSLPLASHLAPVEQHLALEIDFLLASGRLTAHETHIIQSIKPIVANSGTLEDAAGQLQMSYDALKKALQRIRAKTA